MKMLRRQEIKYAGVEAVTLSEEDGFFRVSKQTSHGLVCVGTFPDKHRAEDLWRDTVKACKDPYKELSAPVEVRLKRLAAGVEIKPHPKDVEDLPPEQVRKIREQFERAKTKKPAEDSRDVADEYGHGYKPRKLSASEKLDHLAAGDLEKVGEKTIEVKGGKVTARVYKKGAKFVAKVAGDQVPGEFDSAEKAISAAHDYAVKQKA